MYLFMNLSIYSNMCVSYTYMYACVIYFPKIVKKYIYKLQISISIQVCYIYGTVKYVLVIQDKISIHMIEIGHQYNLFC